MGGYPSAISTSYGTGTLPSVSVNIELFCAVCIVLHYTQNDPSNPNLFLNCIVYTKLFFSVCKWVLYSNLTAEGDIVPPSDLNTFMSQQDLPELQLCLFFTSLNKL